MIKIPKEISPCPIIDALSEVRFQPSTDLDAVYGVLFSEFRKGFPETDKLPITEMPQQIREADSSLRWQPHYRMRSDQFSLQIGPRVLSVSVRGTYCGWHKFREVIHQVVNGLRDSEVVESIDRVSVRYVNFFENTNIYKNLRLGVNSTEEIGELTAGTFQIQTEIPDKHSGAIRKLNIHNAVIAQNDNGQSRPGSVIDIDSIDASATIDDIEEKIESAHEKEKMLFFALLKQEFIDSLNPKY